LSTQEFEAQWQVEQIEQAEIRGRQQGIQQNTIAIAYGTSEADRTLV